jgi:hypothetical protein
MIRAQIDGTDQATFGTNGGACAAPDVNCASGRASRREAAAFRTTRAAVFGGLIGMAALLALAAGCQKDAGVMPPNQAPVTYLSVISSHPGSELDTLGLDYRQILNWWGSDRDGYVTAYLIKWDGGWTPPADAQHWDVDPSWIVTTATTDTFSLATYGLADTSCSNPDLPCPPMYGRHTFSVRAMDNDGATDPIGKTQDFRVGNSPPVIQWSRSFSRPVTSLPAVSFAWHPIDRNGPQTVRSFVYWLTLEAKAAADSFFTADTLIGLGPTAFGAPGSPQPGTWTLHVQAIDDSRTRSIPISHTWTVALPTAKYLLIDNVGDRVPAGQTEDIFFRAMMDSVTAGDYQIMDVEADGGFRTGVEVGPYLSLFKGVVWYSGLRHRGSPARPGNDAVMAHYLNLAEQGHGLLDYLNFGGRILICAQNAVGDSAGLSADFQRDVLGITGFYRLQDLTSLFPDWIHGNITLDPNSWVDTDIEGTPDSLRTTYTMTDIDFLITDSSVAPVFTVPPGFLARVYPDSTGFVLTPDNQTAAPAVLGVLKDYAGDQPGGRIAVTSLLPSRTGPFQTRNRITTALLRRVLFD